MFPQEGREAHFLTHDAAVQSGRQVVIQDLLGDVPVSRLMRTEIAGVSPDLPVSSLVHDWIMRSDEHAFPVMSGQHLDGLVCQGDVRKVPRDAWDTKRVSDIMTPVNRLAVVSPG